jgi:mRNA-degrading endonuclease RelE of RelBE toxin-antitoxin system
MPTEVRYSPVFRKRYNSLAEKYPALESEYEKLLVALENDERPGDKIPRIGHDAYKVRLKNPSARKGKSGGFRVIYYVRLAGRVYLLLVYSKSDESDISSETIRKIIKDILSSEAHDGE